MAACAAFLAVPNAADGPYADAARYIPHETGAGPPLSGVQIPIVENSEAFICPLWGNPNAIAQTHDGTGNAFSAWVRVPKPGTEGLDNGERAGVVLGNFPAGSTANWGLDAAGKMRAARLTSEAQRTRGTARGTILRGCATRPGGGLVTYGPVTE